VLVSVGGLVATATFSGATVSGSPSSFEASNGVMVNDASSTDWNCFGAVTGFSAATHNACASGLTAANAVALHPDTNNGTSGEVTWKSGQKMDAACPALSTNDSVPNKDDFTDIASYNDADNASPPNNYLYGGEIRSTANGNSSGNLELNQAQGTAACPINRTAGDRLLAFDFTGGGTALNFHALTWITAASPKLGGNSGTCNISHDSLPCWGAVVLTTSSMLPDGSTLTVGGCGTTGKDVEGCSNQNAILAGDNGISGNALVAQQFAEFGVNLTKILQIPGCNIAAQEVWESRSSGSSFTSNPEDIEIEQHTISNCGSITVVKNTDPRALDQNFSYSATNLTPSSFTLNDANCTTPGATCSNTQTYSNVPPGSYTVSESATDPTGFGFESLNCTNNGSATDSNKAAITERSVTINLAIHDNVVCTYVNQQQLGAIKVSKTSIKASTALANAHFSVTGPHSFSTTLTTGADGTACVDQLPFGDYTVTETQAPSGYNIDDGTGRTVTVGTNVSCSASLAVSTNASFTDTPKADLTVSLSSEATGGTLGSISCTDGTSPIGNSPQPGTGFAASATLTASGLVPNSDGSAKTYTCTIKVDP